MFHGKREQCVENVFKNNFVKCLNVNNSTKLSTVNVACLYHVPCYFRTVFNVDQRTHTSNLESSEQVVLDGTSKWSCKIQVTGMPCMEHEMSCDVFCSKIIYLTLILF